MNTRLPRHVWRDPGHVLALGLGSGALPVAPGTWGSLLALPLVWWLQSQTVELRLAVAGSMFVVGVWLCGRAARALGVHDHRAIVLDEIVGMQVALLLGPPGFGYLVVGFVLFRLFDIWKPWPISWLDRKALGGFGIMVDDVAAGTYALVVLQIAAGFA